MKYSLYILKSVQTPKYYTGISQNPQRRLEYHNTIEKGFTSRYRPWEIIFTKEYETRQEASKAEIKIKSWKSKKMIEMLVEGKLEI